MVHIDMGRDHIAQTPLLSWGKVYPEYRRLMHESVETIMDSYQSRLSPKTTQRIYSIVAELAAIFETAEAYEKGVREQLAGVSVGGGLGFVSPKRNGAFSQIRSRIRGLQDNILKLKEAAENNPSEPKVQQKIDREFFKAGVSKIWEIVKRDMANEKTLREQLSMMWRDMLGKKG